MAGNGQEFDPAVLHVFLKKIAIYPVGAQIELSDGSQAVVVENNPDFILRPKVRLIQTGKDVDMSEDKDARHLTIKRIIMS